MQESKLGIGEQRTLICTVGLPRSGKSTWAVQQGYPIVCPDAVRLAIHGERFISITEPLVWATVDIMVRALFLAGHHTVILDACNTTKKHRAKWQSGGWRTLFKVIDTPAEICCNRANRVGDKVILPVIDRMAGAFEPLGEGELNIDTYSYSEEK